MQGHVPISSEVATLIAGRFAALADPMRLRILDDLRSSGESPVGALARRLDAGHANVSKHLGVLHAAGVVERRKEGTSVIYRIEDPVVFELCDLVCGALREDFARLGALLSPPALLASSRETP